LQKGAFESVRPFPGPLSSLDAPNELWFGARAC
jgi:hypothetical protein